MDPDSEPEVDGAAIARASENSTTAFLVHGEIEGETLTTGITQVKTQQQQQPHITPKWERTLTGSLVSSSHYLTDLTGSKGAYFVFPDLSCRVEGNFRLRIILTNLAR